MLDCFLTKLTLPSVQRFGRLDQSASRVLSSRKSSTGHSWRPGVASFLGARSSITSSSCVWMPHSLRGAVSLTPTLSLLLFMIIGLILSATLISMQRKSSRFQMFCLHSQKASKTPGLMSSQTARSLLRTGKPSVGGLTRLFRLLSRFSALFQPLISICLCIFSGQMPIQLMSLVAPCPYKILSSLRKLGPWCRKDLGAPQLILWTSQKFWSSLLAPFAVYLLAPKGAKGVVLTSTRVGFSAMWPLPWDLWVLRIIPV